MRARSAQLVAVAAGGSQVGHLLAYQARFGGTALARQSAGAHAYFLPTLTSAVGVVAAAALAAVLLIAWARLFTGRRLGLRTRPGWRALDVLPPLFALQLAIYAGQEAFEASVYGTPVPAVLDLLLWGALGQLPVALVGALALACLSTRLEGALAAVDVRLAQLRPLLIAPGAVLVARPGANRAAVLAECAPAALTKRGPPPTS